MQSYKTNIYNLASQGLANGIKICRNAVDYTIGGKGRYAIIKQEYYPYYIQTKDAYSIIQAIKCEDPLEKQAVDMMKDATDSMNKRSKDGRTTMCILTDEIVQGALGKDALEIEEQLHALLPEIDKAIDAQTRQITVDEVEAVATTASDSTRIGKLVADIYKEQGKDCIINHIEASGTLEDYVVYTDGVHFIDTGLLTPMMVHDEQAKKEGRTEKKAVYERPAILVTKRKISNDNEIAPLVETLLQRGIKDLIIFTDDMDSNVATNLVNTHKAGIMNICIIKAPVLWKQYVFEDFAKVTGATIVEDATGVTFKNLTLDHLGTCGKIIIDRDETTITDIADISDHISDLKSRGDNDSKLRLWWLNTKTATIRLGAHNEGELSLLRLKAEDAVHSSQLALQSGIVAGGGVALFNVAQGIKNEILKKALMAPASQIVTNARGNLEDKTFGGEMGYNAKTKTVVNMFDANIVDAAAVVKNAVRNAVGIASRVLTTEKLIDIPKRTSEELQLEILANSRRPGMM